MSGFETKCWGVICRNIKELGDSLREQDQPMNCGGEIGWKYWITLPFACVSKVWTISNGTIVGRIVPTSELEDLGRKSAAFHHHSKCMCVMSAIWYPKSPMAGPLGSHEPDVAQGATGPRQVPVATASLLHKRAARLP